MGGLSPLNFTIRGARAPVAPPVPPPLLAQTDAWEIMTAEGVQILNDSNMHWVCMSTIGCTENTVNVYDSLNSKVSPAVVKQIFYIARLLLSLFRPLTARFNQGAAIVAFLP